MSDPLVLVHGGAHGAWCWRPLLPHLGDREVLALDLPPIEARQGGPHRHLSPPGIHELTFGDWADAVLAAADEAGYDRFVLVGHSLAGSTIAEVARRAPERVAHLVFVAASVPAEGGAIIDGLPPEVHEVTLANLELARRGELGAEAASLPEEVVRAMFCNDMDEAQTQFVLDHFGAESMSVMFESVSRSGLSPSIPKTYVYTSEDATLPLETQQQFVANLEAVPGGAVETVTLDSGHDVMISHPELLAPALLAILDR